ncbi:TFAM, partial [Symbiodinium pilosum]
TSLLVALLWALVTKSALQFTPVLSRPDQSSRVTLEAAKRKAASAKKVDLDNPPKRPLSGYMRYMMDVRPEVAKAMGDAKITEIAKEIGARWRKLPDTKKKPYQKAFEADKKEFEKQKKAFLDAGGVMPTRRTRGSTRTGKAKKDPNMPKRPKSAYILWVSDNYAALKKKVMAKDPGAAPTEVMKEAGAAWKKLAAASKKKYNTEAEKLKKEYTKEMEEYRKTNPLP